MLKRVHYCMLPSVGHLKNDWVIPQSFLLLAGPCLLMENKKHTEAEDFAKAVQKGPQFLVQLFFYYPSVLFFCVVTLLK